MDVPSPADDLPHALLPSVTGRYLVARATVADVAAVVALLRDDELGTARESATDHDLRLATSTPSSEIDGRPAPAARRGAPLLTARWWAPCS